MPTVDRAHLQRRRPRHGRPVPVSWTVRADAALASRVGALLKVLVPAIPDLRGEPPLGLLATPHARPRRGRGPHGAGWRDAEAVLDPTVRPCAVLRLEGRTAAVVLLGQLSSAYKLAVPPLVHELVLAFGGGERGGRHDVMLIISGVVCMLDCLCFEVF